MSKRPLLLDLFCGGGGAGMGYHRAGFDVIGCDLKPQKRYPFPFVRADALQPPFDLSMFDAIHASPPCQAHSSLKSIKRFNTGKHPDLLEPTRRLLESSGKPYVMENVPGAKLRTHVVLCGSMFGLGTYCDGVWYYLRRHREFEMNWFFLMPLRCHHKGTAIGIYGNGGGRRCRKYPHIGGFTGRSSESREAMGIDWMDRYTLSQSIPPAYTEWIGKRLIEYLS